MKAQFVRRLSFLDTTYLAFSTVITTLFALVLPFSILIIFDRILPNQSVDSLFILFAIILVAIGCDYYLKTQEEVVTSRIMKRYESQLTNKIFNAVLHANMARFARNEMGEYLERISTVNQIKHFFGTETIRAVINSASCLVIISIVALISLPAGAAMFIASCIIFLSAKQLSKQRIKLARKRSVTEGLTNSKVIEIVSSPLEVKSRTMEYRFENVMNSMIEEREEHSVGYERLEASFNLTLAFIQQIAVALVVVICALSVIQLQISQGVMAAIILLTNRYFAPYQQVMHTLSRWQLNQLFIEQLSDIFDIEEDSSNPAAYTNIDKITVSKPSLSFELRKGKAYQFTGPSGSGKTQLLRCLTKQAESEELSILVNDTSLDEIDYSDWKRHVSRIDQHTTLVEGSIIDNLTCYRPHLNKAAYALCENLGIKSEIDQLKAGFYTQLKGHMQNPFSRQVYFSLLIVRALLSQKPLIVIDDFDMHFDRLFAQRLCAWVVSKSDQSTCIVVSNKLNQLTHSLQPIAFKASTSQQQAQTPSPLLKGVI